MAAKIDIESLLAPIAEDNPCGDDPRQDPSFDSPYQKLRDAREEAMSLERVDKSAQSQEGARGFFSDVTKWQLVVDEASSILRDTAKDLEVCALLIEGLARTQGPAGIRDGFILAQRLVTEFWEPLHPRLDPDDPDSLEDRLAGFSGLNGTGQQGPLVRYILQIPITEDTADGQYRCHQYNRALEVSRSSDPETREQSINAMGFTLEDVEKAAAGTGPLFFVGMDEALASALEELQKLDAVFMSVCPAEAPPSSMIAESLQTVRDAIGFLGRDKIAAHRAAQEAGDDREEDSIEDASAAAPAAPGQKPQREGSGAIISREDAVSRMRLIARYFRETEPHSPVSYALENVIRWSTLPLDRLLDEWIDDEHARERYKLMTGMRASDGQQDDGD